MAYNSPKTGQEIDNAVDLSQGPLAQLYTGAFPIVIAAADTWTEINPESIPEGDLVRGFSLPVEPGIQYDGDKKIVFQVSGPFSVSSDTNNVVVTVAVGKNDIPFEGSRVVRKIANQADVGAAGFEYLMGLETGDRITFHVKASAPCTLTVENAAINVIPVAL